MEGVQDEKDADLEQYMISAALIVSGLTSLIQVTRFSVKAPSFYHANRIFLGTGLVSLMGTSFTFLPIAQTAISTMIETGKSLRAAVFHLGSACTKPEKSRRPPAP